MKSNKNSKRSNKRCNRRSNRKYKMIGGDLVGEQKFNICKNMKNKAICNANNPLYGHCEWDDKRKICKCKVNQGFIDTTT